MGVGEKQSDRNDCSDPGKLASDFIVSVGRGSARASFSSMEKRSQDSRLKKGVARSEREKAMAMHDVVCSCCGCAAVAVGSVALQLLPILQDWESGIDSDIPDSLTHRVSRT